MALTVLGLAALIRELAKDLAQADKPMEILRLAQQIEAASAELRQAVRQQHESIVS